jgi:sugar/nucleoside kinase (ribokinase family)
MPGIWTMGELLVEIMRPQVGLGLYTPGPFLGPYPSGAPAIFIDTVARLGHGAGIIGGVGNDDFGRCLLDRLQADGVDCGHVEVFDGRATAVAFVSYFAGGAREFIYHIDGTPAVLAGGHGAERIATPAFFHVMGCSLMANDLFRSRIFGVLAVLHKKGAKVSFDPNIRPELLGRRNLEDVVGPVLQHCHVLLPGVGELALLGGHATVAENVAALFDRTPLEIIVVKRGAAGATVYARSAAATGPTHGIDVGAYPVDEIDPTGAGDCFDAGFLCGLLEGLSLKGCAEVAAAAGALNAGAFGPMAGRITRAAVAEVMRTGRVDPSLLVAPALPASP